MTEWHRRDDFWEVVEPALYSAARLATTSADVEGIARLVSLPPRSRVCDLCCGHGRHALALARAGHRVTGVDRTRLFLDRARAASKAESLDVEWVEADMIELRRPGAFDLIVNLYTSFGYFEDDRDNLRVLENARASLREGGALLIETMGKEIVARHFVGRRWEEMPGGVLSLEERVVRDGWKHLDSRWIVVRDGRRVERTSVQRLYAAGELELLLRQAGFSDVRIYGGFQGQRYDEHAMALVLVAR